MAPNMMDVDSGFQQCSEERFSENKKKTRSCKRRCNENLDKTPYCSKRRKTAECPVTFHSQLSPVSSIIQAVENLSTDSELIADGSRIGCLPTVAGKHRDLKSISSKTMADLLRDGYNHVVDHMTIIDCRYPYEYNGGHIEGAINLYTKDSIQSFIDETKTASDNVHVIIFHCEFSSNRGPNMYRFLRSLDRELNKDAYPRLNFPEVYILEGGYKAFYQNHDSLCQPRDYVPMLHDNHGKDLRHFRVKSKSWTAGDKPKPCYRDGDLNIGKKLFL